MIAIIFAHPWQGSFNKSILDEVVKNLEKTQETYTLIDLNKEEFNPVMRQEDLALYAKGKYNDPLVEKYQSIINQSSHVIYIFPIWWSGPPAIMKGFFDKVFLKNFAYTEGKFMLKPVIDHVERTTIITTSNTPKWIMNLLLGNPIGGTLVRWVLKPCGFKNVKWLHCGYIRKGQDKQRAKFLKSLSNIVF